MAKWLQKRELTMCGRMNITDNEGIRLLMEMIGMPSWPSIQARYNIAPSASLDVLYTPAAGSANESANEVGNEVADIAVHGSMHWGLVPPWAKAGQFKRPLINARSETVREKPSFRNLVDGQRALVPITGFYEWLRKGDSRQPFYFHATDKTAMLIAGLYQENANGEREITLLTTAANDTMAAVHHRMPVIIKPDDALTWLTDQSADQSASVIDKLMQPAANDYLSLYEVDSYVSNARNEGEQCMEPVRRLF